MACHPKGLKMVTGSAGANFQRKVKVIQIKIRLYDSSGKLVTEEFVIPHAVSYTLDGLNLPAGVYVLTVQVGDGDLKAYKLFTNGG